jgi:hypothetical protein
MSGWQNCTGQYRTPKRSCRVQGSDGSVYFYLIFTGQLKRGAMRSIMDNKQCITRRE